MRYFLIDRVLCVNAGKSITAIKNVSLSEDIFTDHFFGNPVMPGAMQIESMAQAATVLLELSSKFKYKALLVMVNNTKFRQIVSPGDTMEIQMLQLSSEDGIVQLDGTIRVKGKKVTSGRLVFSLQPIDEFYPPNTRHLVMSMYQNFLKGADLIGVTIPDNEYG